MVSWQSAVTVSRSNYHRRDVQQSRLPTRVTYMSALSLWKMSRIC